MVEGGTLLVLLLLGRCQHSATGPQPAKKGAAGQEVRGFCNARGPQSIHGTTLAQAASNYTRRDLRFHRWPLHEVSSVVKNTIGRRMPPKGWLWPPGFFD